MLSFLKSEFIRLVASKGDLNPKARLPAGIPLVAHIEKE